jgi:4-cresol dehydrogenase (hydroxylating)
MTTEPAHHDAIARWTAVLGADAVDCSAETLARYARTTQDTATTPSCVLYPSDTEQVSQICHVANETGTVIYPISKGKNWGYGDACATTNGAAIIDLGRMNRIVEVNTELAYAVVEPGVTQKQLSDRLRDTGLWMDCTGAGFEASIIGNTADRGFGHTQNGDHFGTTCGMEVVLPDGRVVRTGFGHYPQAETAHLFPYGVGPVLDGLFSQSNLGVITRIGIWLTPEPEYFSFFYVSIADDAQLPDLIERLRPLRMDGTLRTAVHVANDLRILSGTGRYPWDTAKGDTPLPDAVRVNLRAERGIGAWSAGGALTGSRGQVREAQRLLRRAVGGLGKIVFVDDQKLARGEGLARTFANFGLGKKLGERLETLKPLYNLLKGIPSDEPLLGAQWRLRKPPASTGDPLDFGCGLLWVSPVLPMTGYDTTRLLDTVLPIFERFGFEMLATFTLLNERSLVCILNVVFDKAEAEEAAHARQCYDALMAAIIGAGYIPYRVGPHGMPHIASTDDTFWQLARQLKGALDPNDILARGRYIPEA